MAFFATSGSIISSDGIVAESAGARFVQLYIVADPGVVGASANIRMGTPAASIVALLRSASGGMSPVITLMPSTCLDVEGLDSGDVIALIRK